MSDTPWLMQLLIFLASTAAGLLCTLRGGVRRPDDTCAPEPAACARATHRIALWLIAPIAALIASLVVCTLGQALPDEGGALLATGESTRLGTIGLAAAVLLSLAAAPPLARHLAGLLSRLVRIP